ncbi:MAG TPA: hypothetical protein VE954_13500 [Oligoflexus sp.]|uniref:hypothetical protein n=1 Tax=Oligoflexus sp. TaxID=1971216 RepID=UPI002D4BFEE3|nr:hypothetical protein [Oligoflexus sp.]HYX34118.1 hypothetical protein [Oligoflexus sp.]
MKSSIKSFLHANGLWAEAVSEETEFCRSLMKVLPDGDESQQIARALETTLRTYSSSRMLLAKLCALLKQATGKGPTEIAICLFTAAPDLARSVSEISKLIKAGEMWLKWPMLGDIENPDKLATLKRVPNQLKSQIFKSGEFPDGTSIRGLSCVELRAAVNDLRPGQQPRPPTETPLRVAKHGLINLANAMSGLSELMLGIPEMQGTKAKLDEWHSEILRALTASPEKIKPAVFIRPSADNNRAIMSKVTSL